mmetsp:Transcript_65746/g.144198  ORF Transcript_65746/g.144198 Transcript_65746/m.144198 type:complete len:453 (-) Transcript_65746:62-1420(-)
MQRGWQQLCHSSLVLWREGVRELDGQDQEQVPMHKRIFERWHALILHCLHHAEGLLCIWIRHDVHSASSSSFLSCKCFLAGALLEVGALAIHHEAAHVDAFALQLCFTRLLQSIDVRSVCLRDILYAGAICVFDNFPLGLRFLLGQWVKALAHGFHDFTWRCLNLKLSAIEVRQLHCEAAQRLDQRDLALNEKVGPLALEVSMFLLLQNKNHIAGISVGMFISHLSKDNLVSIWRTLLDVHLQDLSFLLGLEAFSLSTAVVALRLHLLNHWPHSDHFYLHATAITLAAFLDTLLLVDDLSRDGHLLGVARIHLLQGHFQVLNHVLGLLTPSGSTTATSTTSEEGFKDVRRIARAVIVQALLSEFVVLGSLVLVTQHLIGAGDLLELLRVTALVWVMLHGQPSVGLLDLGLVGILVHFQEFVELAGVNIFGSASSFATHPGKVTSRKAAEEHD